MLKRKRWKRQIFEKAEAGSGKEYRFRFHFTIHTERQKLECGASFCEICDEKYNCFINHHWQRTFLKACGSPKSRAVPYPYQLKDESCS